MQEQFKQQEAIATLQQRQRGANEDELPLPLLSSNDTFQQRRQSWSQSDQHSLQGQNQGQQSTLKKTSADGNLPQSSSVLNEHNLQQSAPAMQLQGLGLQSLASMQPQTKLVRQEKFQSSSSTPILGVNMRIQNNNNNNNQQQQQTNNGMTSQAQPQQLQVSTDLSFESNTQSIFVLRTESFFSFQRFNKMPCSNVFSYRIRQNLSNFKKFNNE